MINRDVHSRFITYIFMKYKFVLFQVEHFGWVLLWCTHVQMCITGK